VAVVVRSSLLEHHGQRESSGVMAVGAGGWLCLTFFPAASSSPRAPEHPRQIGGKPARRFPGGPIAWDPGGLLKAVQYKDV
jgi:hypothetical protein